MSLGSANSTTVQQRSVRHRNQGKNSDKPGSDSGFSKILQQGRLTDEDLEHFQLNILRAHKKRHYRVLSITVLLFIIIGAFIYILF